MFTQKKGVHFGWKSQCFAAKKGVIFKPENRCGYHLFIGVREPGVDATENDLVELPAGLVFHHRYTYIHGVRVSKG